MHCLSLRYRKNSFLKINFYWSVVVLRYRKKQGFPGGSDSKEAACKAEDLIPGSGRSPGEGNGHPLQYSCLENPRGQRSLVGYSPRGRRSRTRRSDSHSCGCSTMCRGLYKWFPLCSKVTQLLVCTYPLFFGFPSYEGHHRALSRVPCAVQEVLITYLFYIKSSYAQV